MSDGPTLKVDLDVVRRYLKALTGDERGKDTCWQVFGDADKSRPAEKTWSREFIDLIEDRNAKGYGIFIAVNSARESAAAPGNPRGITTPRAWIIDADGGARTDAWHQPPSIHVVSKGGPHGYWLCAPGTTLDEVEQGNKALAVHYRSDPAVVEAARVLRVPGTLHMKTPGDPFMVRLVEADASRVYTAADLPRPAPSEEEWSDYLAWNHYRKGVIEHGGDAIVDVEDERWADVKDRAAAWVRFLATRKAAPERTAAHAPPAWVEAREPDEWAIDADWLTAIVVAAKHKDQLGAVKIPALKKREAWVALRPALMAWVRDVKVAERKGKEAPTFTPDEYAARAKEAPADGAKGGPSTFYRGDRTTLDIVSLFRAKGLLKSPLGQGKWAVTCPFADHPDSGSTTVIWEGVPGEKVPAIHCSRGRCAETSFKDLIEIFGADEMMAHTAEVNIFLRGSDVELAQDMVRKLNPSRSAFDGGSVWVVGDDSLWHPRSEEALHVDVMRYDGRKVVTDKGLKPLSLNRSRIKGTRELIEDVLGAATRGLFDSPPAGLPTRSGIVALDGTVTPYTPEAKVRASDVVEVEWDATAECPRWRRFIGEVLVTADQIALLQEMFGAALWGLSTRYEAALVMIGEGRNGKSTALSVLESLFQRGAVTSVPPALWHQEYQRAHLASARLNCVRDMPSRELVDGGEIKQLISGEQTTARLPYGRPFEFKPKAAHVFACNALPSVADRSDGFWRRFRALAFDVQVPEDRVDVGLGAKLRAERPGIAAWAREGAVRLVAQNGYTKTRRGEELAQEWRQDNDPVGRFVAECVEPETGSTPAMGLYGAYEAWAIKNGHRPLSSTKFGTELKRLGLDKLKHRTKAGVVYKVAVRHTMTLTMDEETVIEGMAEVFADEPPAPSSTGKPQEPPAGETYVLNIVPTLTAFSVLTL